jgi:ABC-type phosphate transport system permease subunit
VQTVFSHVVPLAMPGMLTGTIIGMARALGETAPLLMIGMVAFIVDIPGSLTDPATVLPVQIYLWADSSGAVSKSVLSSHHGTAGLPGDHECRGLFTETV